MILNYQTVETFCLQNQDQDQVSSVPLSYLVNKNFSTNIARCVLWSVARSRPAQPSLHWQSLAFLSMMMFNVFFQMPTMVKFL